MIDTVILSIQRSSVVSVSNPTNETLGWNQQSNTPAYTKFIRNPSKKDIDSGLYFPRLTGIKRKIEGRADSFIKIEFSIPKLLYKNNLDEVEENDFNVILELLQDRLTRMGIIVQEKYLRYASVSAVHYSKNIQLVEGYTSQFVISELNKVDIRKSFDFTKTRFMNDGQSICAYANAHSFVIYDKIADLKKDSKRAIDKDQTKYQMSLFDELDKKELYEVLRFEIRLSKKQKLNSLFKKLGFPENPTFKDVFSKKISQSVVSYYWKTLIENNSLLLFSFVTGPKDILKQVLIADPSLKPKQALYFTSLIIMTKDGNGTRELRSILSKYSDNRTWYRIKDDIKKVVSLVKKVRQRDWFYQVENSIEKFETFKANPP